MTPDKIKKAFDACAKMIQDKYYGPFPTPLAATQFPHGALLENEESLLCYALHMCVLGKELVAEGRIEKAMRWLGFVQGVMWSVLPLTISDLKDINKPEEGEQEKQEAPAKDTKGAGALGALLAAEANYLHATGWNPYVHITDGTVYWRCTKYALDTCTQTEAVAIQRNIDESLARKTEETP